MTTKKNGVHMDILATPAKPKRLHKPRPNRDRRILATKSCNNANEAVIEAYKAACKIYNGDMKGSELLLFIEAALQDKFLPLGKLVVRDKGTRITQVMSEVHNRAQLELKQSGLAS